MHINQLLQRLASDYRLSMLLKMIENLVLRHSVDKGNHRSEQNYKRDCQLNKYKPLNQIAQDLKHDSKESSMMYNTYSMYLDHIYLHQEKVSKNHKYNPRL